MAHQSWAPQSPDLSGYAPQSPDLSAYKAKVSNQNPTWTPQSPDIGELPHHPQLQHQPPPPPTNFTLDSGWDHKPQGFGGPYPTSAYPQFQEPTSHPAYYPQDMPSTRSARVKDEDAEWTPQNDFNPPQQHSAPVDQKPSVPRQKMDTHGIEVKTKFPVARIKRIMQADEDVGKVAQVTPVVMAKALELFMIRLITASSGVAKSRNSKRVTTQHMKQAVMQDDQFDNLREIVDKVPDAPAKKGAADSDDEDGEAPKKRKKSTAGGKGKKRRNSDDDF
ncbi:DNA polymerase epsilon subunit C [Elsinoe australis]|uniref:NCT transcriptional regulatory complex subunit A n=1 Tax=Elsinoe australis TaxID=40998 RepID=A0A2P7ZD82_9PEZI|nr:DNA polymerase epsilon subunit C [Elsinoe australis]